MPGSLWGADAARIRAATRQEIALAGPNRILSGETPAGQPRPPAGWPGRVARDTFRMVVCCLGVRIAHALRPCTAGGGRGTSHGASAPLGGGGRGHRRRQGDDEGRTLALFARHRDLARRSARPGASTMDRPRPVPVSSHALALRRGRTRGTGVGIDSLGMPIPVSITSAFATIAVARQSLTVTPSLPGVLDRIAHQVRRRSAPGRRCRTTPRAASVGRTTSSVIPLRAATGRNRSTTSANDAA